MRELFLIPPDLQEIYLMGVDALQQRLGYLEFELEKERGRAEDLLYVHVQIWKVLDGPKKVGNTKKISEIKKLVEVK